MNRSIRLRIALSVLATVALCLVALSLYVLDHVDRVQHQEVDELLLEELGEVVALLGSPQLQTLVGAESERNTKWNETFFEVRDARGKLVASSDNLPRQGLRRPGQEGAQPQGPVFWEVPHPRSRRGHVRIRLVEARANEHTIVVARTLRHYQRTYWRLRARLAVGLLGASLLGGLCAWGVAAYSLTPIRRIAARAAALGASPDGELPVSGRGDELDRLAVVLNDLLNRIRAEVARVRRMTADAAHALRTPLTALRGALEVQLRGGDPELVPKLAPALESSEELARLVNRLLLLERIESRSPNPRSERIRLDKLVTELVDALQVVAADRGIEVVCECDAALVTGDAGELREATLNLLDNALRHTPPGGRVSVRVDAAPGVVRVVVTDSGPGLGPEQVDLAFERFYSTAGNGSGLGLPIARAVAEAHGGSLTAAPGAGARFVLELPT